MSDIRAGDRERNRTATDLGQALAQGYLPMAEYEDRLGRAFAAHSAGELDALVTDLPVARLRHNDPRRRAAQLRAARLGVRIHIAAYLAGALLMLGIWLAVGLGGGAGTSGRYGRSWAGGSASFRTSFRSWLTSGHKTAQVEWH